VGLTTPHSKKLLLRKSSKVISWIDLTIDRENGEVFFERPKPTAGCSANGRRRRLVLCISEFTIK